MARLLVSIAVALTLEELIRQGYRKATNRDSTRSRSLMPQPYKNTPISTVTNQIPLVGNIVDLFAGDSSIATY